MALFMFATGIENSYPKVGRGDAAVRRDEMAETGHTGRWRDDLALVADLGIRYLRHGPAYYLTHLGPGRYDWSFTDDVMAEMRARQIVPIADLCHFGVPDWLGDFQNPDFPRHFAEYTRAFARRYPWVQLFTPVNEIFIAAMFSAQYGWWNECKSDDRSFTTALKHLCMANLLAMRAILDEQPEAIFIHSESTEYFHAGEPCCLEAVRFLNEKRFLALDLSFGYPLSATMYEYLCEHGMSKAEFHWFRDNQVAARCVMGNDYYVTNEHLVHPDGSTSPAGEILGYYVITHQYFSRYGMPCMHTETNFDDASRAPAWLRKEWANVHRLKQDGVPVLGFTWYSLLDQIDWDVALREKRGRVNPVGLFDLDRNIRPVGAAYRELVRAWNPVLRAERSFFWLDL